MDLINISRVLLRRRLWVGLTAGLALVVAVYIVASVTFTPLPSLHSRQYQIGEATVHVLVDTPSSQVADLDPPIGSDALAQRASLFANLMGTQPVEARIAAKTGISTSRLLVVAPSTTSPLIPTPDAVQAGKANVRPADYRLTVRADDTLPIITLDAEAPNAVQAAALANGAFVALSEHLAAIANTQKIPGNRRPVVTALGGATAGEAARGPRLLYGLIGGILVFVLGCALIVIADGAPRRWRELKSESATDADPLLAPEPEPDLPARGAKNGTPRVTNGIPHEVTTHG